MKEALSNRPVLNQPDFTLPFSVATDASDSGVGAVLFQEPKEGVRKYIAFVSKALTSSQRNYPVLQKELLAIVYGLSRFRDYLYGNRFYVLSDHEALKFLHRSCRENKTIAYWYAVLSEFDFEIVHIPGISNYLPDSLSRVYQSSLPDLESVCKREVREPTVEEPGLLPMDENLEGDSTSKTLPDDAVHAIMVAKIDTLGNGMEVDEEVTGAADFVRHIRDTVDKIYPDPEDRMKILAEAHQEHQGGRGIVQKVWEMGYFWPGLAADARRFIKSCRVCLSHTVQRMGFHPLKPKSALFPMDLIGMDTFTLAKGVISNGFSCILIIVDYATSFVFLEPLVDGTADSVMKNMIRIFAVVGKPLAIRMDGGREFVNHNFNKYCTDHAIDVSVSLPEHQQANGRVEAHVKIAKRALKTQLNGEINRWAECVYDAQFILNTRVTARHGSTPFSLMFARRVNMQTADRNLNGREFSEVDWEERAKTMVNTVFPAVAARTAQYNSKMVEQFRKAHKIVDGFVPGSYVYRLDTSTKKKSLPKYVGPYCVVTGLPDGGYLLRDGTGTFFPSSVAAKFLKSALVDVDDSGNTFEVERILKHGGDKENRRYFVKWKNYPESDNSWVQAADLQADQLVHEYWVEVNKASFALKRRRGKR